MKIVQTLHQLQARARTALAVPPPPPPISAQFVQCLHSLSFRAALAALCPVLLAVSGCIEAPRPPPVAVSATDQAELQLTEAAIRAEAALTALARIESAGTPGADVPRLVPPELLRRISLDWIGPLDILADRLAREAGYSFNAAGTPPVRPRIVEVRVSAKPLILVLRDAGIQAGSAANLAVDPDRRQIRLVWIPGKGKA